VLATALLTLAAPASAAVVGWGENSHGPLGAGYTGGNTLAVATLLQAPPVEVVTGSNNGYARMADGTVEAWGGDNYGQDCNGRKSIRYVNASPKPTLLHGIAEVSASGAHLIARTTAGTVYTCGSDGYGQGGNGFTAKGLKTGIEYGQPTPELVEHLAGVVKVWAGGPDNIVLTSSGQLLGFGQNKAGELGPPAGEHTRPAPMPAHCPVADVAAGGNPTKAVHILILCTDGTVEADGAGRYGQLGDGALEVTGTFHKVVGLAGVTAVSTSDDESMAIAGGHVFTWGENEVGELGVGTGPETCVVAGTGSRPCSKVPVQVPGLAGVEGINAGAGFAFAWTGALGFSWGFNLHGELGQGTFSAPHTTPGRIEETGVLQVSSQEHSANAVISGPAPPPVLTGTAGEGSITAQWRDGGETSKWLMGIRPVTHPLSAWTYSRLAPAERTDTFRGLTPGQPYEVRVHDTNFGTRIVTATPK
jgi:alpha-tubulin suppressor-like RCC1 family protein